MLERHGKSRFMPNTYVFPGGVIDKADFSSDWLDLFSRHGCKPTIFDPILNIKGQRPQLMTATRSSQVSNELAFRICTIRETFEESGILLTKDAANINTETATPSLSYEYKHPFSADDLENWRLRVHNNAHEFIQLCRHINHVPDVWSLLEWSNWLTPADLGPLRYNTMFYICCVDSVPDAYYDEREMSNLKWLSPMDGLSLFKQESILLAPPQSYELSRLCNYSNIKDLHEFTVNRSDKGCEFLFPVRVNAADGIISLIPGDDMYPKQPDLVGEREIIEIEQSVVENRQSTKNLNRVELLGVFNHDFHCNVSPAYGHVKPILMSNIMKNLEKCKL
uniref:Nucleoside diphosphate-linked moiety X motif 19, mitochondrial-like n=1 Tax=Saccoglossus kowalevskii TaxID=10224 RepID=A0ABM0H050_SACKO|nr:PREDICTED: nucleoside diphosphate-linked moiety X motif 19, mitochondrial-like [Saccoglossus kowalevskii]